MNTEVIKALFITLCTLPILTTLSVGLLFWNMFKRGRFDDTERSQFPTQEDLKALPNEELRETASTLCAGIKRDLTHVVSSIPAEARDSVLDRFRILCSSELKESLSLVAMLYRKTLTEELLNDFSQHELSLYQESIQTLSELAKRVDLLDKTASPLLKSWSAEASSDGFRQFVEEFEDVCGKMDELYRSLHEMVMDRAVFKLNRPASLRNQFLLKVKSLSELVEHDSVGLALIQLQELATKRYEFLSDEQMERMNSYYLKTLSTLVESLAASKKAHVSVEEKVGICLRVIRVISEVLQAADSGAKIDFDEAVLSAEAVAMENIAKLKGDFSEGETLSV